MYFFCAGGMYIIPLTKPRITDMYNTSARDADMPISPGSSFAPSRRCAIPHARYANLPRFLHFPSSHLERDKRLGTTLRCRQAGKYIYRIELQPGTLTTLVFYIQHLPTPDLSPLTDPQFVSRVLTTSPEKSQKDGAQTGWRGLGTRMEVLELDAAGKS